MQKTAWKSLAIIFFILLVLETSLITYGVVLVLDDQSNAELCAINMCEYDYTNENWAGIYDGYSYDTETNICSCWEGESITLTKLMP